MSLRSRSCTGQGIPRREAERGYDPDQHDDMPGFPAEDRTPERRQREGKSDEGQ